MEHANTNTAGHPCLLLPHHGDEIEYDLPGYGHVEGPRLLPGGDDLLRGEELPIVARVPQLHSIAGMSRVERNLVQAR